MTEVGRALCACLAGASALTPEVALAGNDDTYFMDGEASMTGGAVTGTTAGPGSLWYNPAGLGAVDRDELNVSLTAAVWQRQYVKRGLVVLLPDGSQRSESIDGSRFNLVSPSVAYVGRIGKLAFAAGLFTSRDEVIRLSNAVQLTDASGRRGLEGVDLDGNHFRYHLGVGTGIRVHPRVRLGISLFAVLDNNNDNGQLVFDSEDPNAPEPALAAGSVALRDESMRVGIAATLGVQVEPVDGFLIGLTFRTPILHLHEFLNASTSTLVTSRGVFDGTPVDFTFTEFDDAPRRAAPVGQLWPLRLILGAALERDWGWVSVEGDYSPPLTSLRVDPTGSDQPEYLVEREAVWNLRAGALLHLSQTVDVGVGLFTDRSPAKKPELFDEFRVDYYGMTAGVGLTTPVALDRRERTDKLLFRTTLSVRYAVGVGDTGQTIFDLSNPSSILDIRGAGLTDLVFHELYLFIGSSLAY